MNRSFQLKKETFYTESSCSNSSSGTCSWIWKCGICNGCWRHPENCAGVDSRRSDRCNINVENGNYTLDYKDADGNDVSQGGGGVAYENGTERPLTADELLDEINMPEVEYEEDGTVWGYYLNQKMEITDKFEDGVCFVQLKADGQTQYITVKYQMDMLQVRMDIYSLINSTRAVLKVSG